MRPPTPLLEHPKSLDHRQWRPSATTKDSSSVDETTGIETSPPVAIAPSRWSTSSSPVAATTTPHPTVTKLQPTPSPNSALTIAKHSLHWSPSQPPPLPTPPSPNTTGCAIAHHRPVRTAVQRCHRRRPVRPPVPPAPSSSSATSSATPSPASSFVAVDHFSDSPANRSEVTADAAVLPPPKMLYDALPPPALPHS
nr:hypothetical protein Iba_chr09cCG13170 [Ipomoea batatas]